MSLSHSSSRGFNDEDQAGRVPSLAYYCYKYINSQLPSIQDIGNLPYSLCEPFLKHCSPEQLLILEKNSPHLMKEDQLVWQNLCFRDFHRWELQFKKGEIPEPACWRDQYFSCRVDEERRLEEVGMRVRNRRQEAVQEKKERQVIITNKLPPPKRTKYNAAPYKPKTLFQKTRAESLKIQRMVYGRPTLPASPAAGSKAPRPYKPFLPSTPKPVTPTKASTASCGKDIPATPMTSTSSPSPSPAKSTASFVQPGGSPPFKKDPMTTLFMPKHRTYSQLPSKAQRN